jgi:acetyl esterase
MVLNCSLDMRLTLGQRLRLSRGAVLYSAVDAAAHTLARLRYALPDAQPERHHVVLEPNVPYGNSRHDHHRLDVYIPMRAKRPAPIVMYVHGGAFASLSKDTHRVMALAIARRGYVVFNINYRMGFRHPFPEPLEDVASALLWVNANADRFGGDRLRIAVAGESAGGNLVTAVAVMHSKRQNAPFARRVYDANISIRAILSTYPYLDLTDRYETHPRLARWYKMALFDAASSYLSHHVFAEEHDILASPIRALEGAGRAGAGFTPDRPLPPFFIACGSRDPFLQQCQRLKEALDRLDVPAELFIAPGEIHAFDAMVWRAPARAKWKATHAFLSKHMQLQSSAPSARVSV